MINDYKEISLNLIIKRHKGRISITWLLVILEAIIILILPLSIGITIDSLINGSLIGILYLIGLGILILIVGAGRRYYDTRLYSKIYATIAPELVENEKQHDSNISVIAARANLLTEFIEFLENSFPNIISGFIVLFGTILIIIFLDFNIFIGCLISSGIIIFIYLISSKRIFYLNQKYNDDLEKQVQVISSDNELSIKQHFRNVMKWNIKLSDLETVNFSLIWLILLCLLIYSVFIHISKGILSYGQVFSTIMYVFEYLEGVIILPLYYEQFIRLKEISNRLKNKRN